MNPETTGAAPGGLPAIEAWMRQRGVGWICALSPHLDDVAFSIPTILAHTALPPREVWTVFSASTADGDMGYANATGFANPLEEFEARRAEDREAMRLIGVPFRHVGAVASRFDAAMAASIVDDLRAQAHQRAGRTLVLLPAGAGIEPSAVRRLWGRLTRTPVGCRPHGEHEMVRDAVAAAFAPGRAGHDDPTVGYYAEVPYLWSEGPRRLETRLRSIAGQPLEPFAVAARVDFKFEIAHAYRSQVALELGEREYFRRLSLSGDERLYLPS
jgi:hypothetical protein